MSTLKTNFSRTAFAVFFIYLIALSFSYPDYSTAKQNDYWPTKGWKASTPEAQGIDSNLLVNMLENIKKEAYHTKSITIVRSGVMVLDVYFHGSKPDKLNNIYSCTKSIMSILIGIAIDHGYIKDIHQPVISLFPERRFANLDERKKAMTLEHVLMMASGLKCQSSWKYKWTGLRALWRSEDWVQFILDLPMEEYPGTHHEYSNSGSFLLSAILQEVTGMKALDFARKHLFKPLGITDVEWESNPHGITIGYSGLYLKSQDMAKIGYLSLNQGQWEGRQIVSKNWMKTSTRKHIDHPSRLSLPEYGYQWWVHPDGFHVASGIYGQKIYVMPKKNLVVVFTSFKSKTHTAPRKLLDNYIRKAVKSDITLPSAPENNHRLNTLLDGAATESTKFFW